MMHITLIDNYHTEDSVEYVFDTHTGLVKIEYNMADYQVIKGDPQMDIHMHAFMRCACKMQSSSTITQTVGGA